MLLTKKWVIEAVMIVTAFGTSGLACWAADQTPSAPAEKKGGGRPPTA